MKKVEEVVVRVANPSEVPHCKFPATCDQTRACERYRRKGEGCGTKENTVYTWPPESP